MSFSQRTFILVLKFFLVSGCVEQEYAELELRISTLESKQKKFEHEQLYKLGKILDILNNISNPEPLVGDVDNIVELPEYKGMRISFRAPSSDIAIKFEERLEKELIEKNGVQFQRIYKGTLANPSMGHYIVDFIPVTSFHRYKLMELKSEAH